MDRSHRPRWSRGASRKRDPRKLAFANLSGRLGHCRLGFDRERPRGIPLDGVRGDCRHGRSAGWQFRQLGHGMRNLIDVLVELGLGSEMAGWDLEQATAVSADGLNVVGWGYNPAGDEEAWVAPPLAAEPSRDSDGLECSPRFVWRPPGGGRSRGAPFALRQQGRPILKTGSPRRHSFIGGSEWECGSRKASAATQRILARTSPPGSSR